MRDVRTKADEGTIAKALEGDYRPEHVFALKQSLELFDTYQKQIQACDDQVAAHLSRLESKAAGGLKAVRGRRTNGAISPASTYAEKRSASAVLT
jgi:hypothetical protein